MKKGVYTYYAFVIPIVFLTRIRDVIMSKLNSIKITLAGLSIALLFACSSGDDGGSSVSSLTGQFVDSPVEGVSYVAGGFSGTTAADGSFSYGSGNSLILSIGDINLGDGIARNIFTPLTLVGTTNPSDTAVVNIASFLLTLDDNGDPNNGILITEAVRAAAIGKTINFA